MKDEPNKLEEYFKAVSESRVRAARSITVGTKLLEEWEKLMDKMYKKSKK